MRTFAICILCISTWLSGGLDGVEPNPPKWPDSVIVVEPGDETVQQKIQNIFNENGGNTSSTHGQWSQSRYAILLKPGDHQQLDIPVGYYTSVIGLGLSPDDTQLGDVYCEDGSTDPHTAALCNFWRSVENFATNPTKCWNGDQSFGMLWSVSQASPMRRINVNAHLSLSQNGYSSGGFMADCIITGLIDSGSQQQWCFRNTSMGGWKPQNNINLVFIGCEGSLPAPANNTALIDETPVIAEKPYIIFDNGKYYLMIPDVEKKCSGPSENYSQGNKVAFDQVYVATQSDSAAVINAKLKQDLHVILTPGNYKLDEPIHVTQANTCILGLGFPTLISTQGNSCIVVDDVPGVKIAGVLLEAGTDLKARPQSDSNLVLLKWGNNRKQAKQGVLGLFHRCLSVNGEPDNPGFLYDCFVRVGGPNDSTKSQVYADLMVQINSSHVVCDNLWLWRADHDIHTKPPHNDPVRNRANPCQTGIEVNGDDVIAYGLAVEHTLANLTQWNGERGQVYFYQSEYPYDVTQSNYADKGYVSYRVADSVQNHEAYGIGVYAFFRDSIVNIDKGIQTPSPEGKGIHFSNIMSVYLSGFQEKGQITHVINDKGTPANAGQRRVFLGAYP